MRKKKQKKDEGGRARVKQVVPCLVISAMASMQFIRVRSSAAGERMSWAKAAPVVAVASEARAYSMQARG